MVLEKNPSGVQLDTLGQAETVHGPDARGGGETDIVGGRSVAHDPAGPNRLEFHNLIKGQGFGVRPGDAASHDDQHVAFEQMGQLHATEHDAKTVGGKGLTKVGRGGQDRLMLIGKFYSAKKSAETTLDLG